MRLPTHSHAALPRLQEEQERRSEVVSERNDELARLVARLEEAQALLEERGSSMSDASPLVRAAAAAAALHQSGAAGGSVTAA
jgi:hypothetical protein